MKQKLDDFTVKELLNALCDKLFSTVGGPPWDTRICVMYRFDCQNCPAQNEYGRCISEEWESYLLGMRERFDHCPEPEGDK